MHTLSSARRRLLAVVAALVLATGGLFALQSQAEARQQVGIYIAFPTWLANCPNAGSVMGIWLNVNRGGSINADMGDDKTWVGVEPNQNNVVSYTVMCSRGRVLQPGYNATIRPTRGSQTWWIGPGGTTHN